MPLEYRRSESVPVTSAQQPLEQPSTMTHTVDSSGHTDWFANLYSSAHGSDSITTVQHIYVVGVMADWLGIMNSLETFRDIFDIAMMSLLVVLLARLLGNLAGPRPQTGSTPRHEAVPISRRESMNLIRPTLFRSVSFSSFL